MDRAGLAKDTGLGGKSWAKLRAASKSFADACSVSHGRRPAREPHLALGFISAFLAISTAFLLVACFFPANTLFSLQLPRIITVINTSSDAVCPRSATGTVHVANLSGALKPGVEYIASYST